jgi:hypothetical protein
MTLAVVKLESFYGSGEDSKEQYHELSYVWCLRNLDQTRP